MIRRDGFRAAPFFSLLAWVTLIVATVLEWRWQVRPSFGGPLQCTVRNLCDTAEAGERRELYTGVASFAITAIAYWSCSVR